MIVIHVGLRKSGSTSIQNFLRVNAEALRAMGVEYPPIGRTKRGTHINLSYEIRGHGGFDPKYGTLSQLFDFWRDANSKTMILSSENFEACDADQAARMKELSGAKGDPVRIVMVIRDLLDLMPSGYFQMVRTGLKTYDFDAFFDRRIRMQQVAYAATAKCWADAFGWESLQVRILDPRFLVNGDLIDDFLTVSGLDLKQDAVRALARPGLKNVSPGWRVVEAVRALYSGRHGLPDNHPLGDFALHTREQRNIVGLRGHEVGERMGWNADRGRYLTRPQAQQCLDIYRDTVESLNKYLIEALPLPLDLDARSFAERAFLPDAAHIPSKELRAFYDETARDRAARPILRVSRDEGA